MSLTSLLKNTDIVSKLQQVFPLQRLAEKREILAEPLTSNYSRVGQAFDYLLRFAIQHEYSGAIEAHGWIAEGYAARHGHIDLFSNTSRARDELTRYKADGIVTDELIQSCLDLSIIDAAYRSGVNSILDGLGKYDRRDIQDMRNLLSIAPMSDLASHRPIILNPTFNRASFVVGGADIDLVLGDTLVDIKTTKKLGLEPRDFYQVLGYYLLYRIDGIAVPNKFKDKVLSVEIHNIGIYYSRYAYLYSLCMDEYSTEQIEQGIEILKSYGREYFPKPYEHSGLFKNDDNREQRTLQQMIDEVNKLKSTSEYYGWLDRLSKHESIIWNEYPNSKYLADIFDS